MQDTASVINTEDLEVGFWRGVSRAREGGLDLSGVLDDRAELIDMIKEIMTDMKDDVAKNEPKKPPIWNPRAVRHAAENITTFEIAWRLHREPSSPSMTKEDMKGYLDAFRIRGNCWSHER